MLVVMQAHATAENIRAVCDKIESLGYRAHSITGAERTAIVSDRWLAVSEGMALRRTGARPPLAASAGAPAPAATPQPTATAITARTRGDMG